MTYLEVNQIEADPTQPRQSFDPREMELLKASISKQGILVPLMVEKHNGKYLLVDGERRYRTAVALKLKEVPVEIMDKMTDSERMIKRFHLQDQHSNWTHFDRARAIQFFYKTEKMTPAEVADTLGIGASTVSRWLEILKLSKRSQELMVSRRLPFSYVSHIGLLANRYTSITDESVEKIEEELIGKLDRHEIRKNGDFDEVSRVFNKEEPKRMLEFLHTKLHTKGLLTGSKAGASVQIDTMLYAGMSFKNRLVKASVQKINKEISQLQVEKFLEIKKAIDIFIK